LFAKIRRAYDAASMTVIQYVRGDALCPQTEDRWGIIAHVVNDQGGFGKGFALSMSRKFPDAREHYREWFRRGHRFALGEINLLLPYPDETLLIAHMLAQRGYRSSTNPHPLDLQALRNCLIQLAHTALDYSAIVHMPLIGTGYGGASWADVRRQIKETLCTFDVPVKVYLLDQDIARFQTEES
jgi:O-acetyl-ADP-ribose deacetylase (regulator of RNase III)